MCRLNDIHVLDLLMDNAIHRIVHTKNLPWVGHGYFSGTVQKHRLLNTIFYKPDTLRAEPLLTSLWPRFGKKKRLCINRVISLKSPQPQSLG